jgi:hypothetical protein|tara:strand:- start:780 stop:896 length:117 start_codon:yes stop_codon:yes gene_type:complete
MRLTSHQFIDESFFFPDCEVEHLLIGAFNPEDGETADY